MNHLRRLQAEQPVVFWVLVALGLFVGFQLVLSVVGLLLGPFGLPSWVPIVVVVGGLVLIARGQQRSRRGRSRPLQSTGHRPGRPSFAATSPSHAEERDVGSEGLGPCAGPGAVETRPKTPSRRQRV